MGVAEAQQWYDLRPGDPPVRYIVPEDAKASLSQVYADMFLFLSGPNTIGTSQLIAGSVTSLKLADGAVTTVKLATGAVTEAKLANGSITSDKLSPGLEIDGGSP